jgi:hypothetical protein
MTSTSVIDSRDVMRRRNGRVPVVAPRAPAVDTL